MPLVSFDGLVYLEAARSLSQQEFHGYPSHRHLGYPLFLMAAEALSKSIHWITATQVLLFATAYRHVILRLCPDQRKFSSRSRILHFIGFVAFVFVLGGYNLTVLPQSITASLLLFQLGNEINRSHTRCKNVLSMLVVNSFLILTTPISAFVVLLSGKTFFVRRRFIALGLTCVVPFVLLFSSLWFQSSVQHRTVKVDVASLPWAAENSSTSTLGVPSALGYQGDPFWRFLFTGTWDLIREDSPRLALGVLYKFSTILGVDPPWYPYKPYINSLNGGPNDAIFSVAPQLHLTNSCRLVPSAPRLSVLANFSDSERYGTTCAKPDFDTPHLIKLVALASHKWLTSALLIGLLLFFVQKRDQTSTILAVKRRFVLYLIFFWCVPYAILANTSDTASLARYGSPLRPIFMIIAMDVFLAIRNARNSPTKEDRTAI